MRGVLPPEMKEFIDLQILQFEDGLIGGEIPSELGSLPQLAIIDLNFNSLVGSIPDTIYSLTNLRQLDLNDNKLTGSMSTLIGQLVSLEFLSVDMNLMTGEIPEQIGNLSQLGKSLAVNAGGVFGDFRTHETQLSNRSLLSRLHSLQALPPLNPTAFLDQCQNPFASCAKQVSSRLSLPSATMTAGPRHRLSHAAVVPFVIKQGTINTTDDTAAKEECVRVKTNPKFLDTYLHDL